MRMRKHRANRCGRGAAALLSLTALLAAAGCGGGGDTTAPAITTLPDTVVTAPSPITYAGGTATLKVKVTDGSGVNPATVKVNVATAGGASLTNGPQPMTLSGTPDVFTYGGVTVPNNLNGAAPVVYTVTVSAADTIGNTTLAPVAVGTISVPNPPPPPGGP